MSAKQTADTDDQVTSGERLRDIVMILKHHDIIHGISPEKLKSIMEDLGPTYIKFGQLMSMHPDLIPQEYCDALSELRTDVKPFSYEEVIRVIEDEYGTSVHENFSEISPACIGSASIAQTHKARLKNGQIVAVKVQRPNISQAMERDVQLLRKAVGIVRIVARTGNTIDFKEFIDEMWVAAQLEMNFTIEADNIREFSRLHEDIEYIAFPKVERQLTTPRVLVMEYIDGIQIDHLTELNNHGYDLNEIGMKIAENYVKQVVDDGLFHADPHPGNIRIRDGKIIWLDLGMIGRLNNHDRTLINQAIAAVFSRNIVELEEIILTIGMSKGDIDHARLQDDLEGMLRRYGDMELGNLDLGKLMTEILTICKNHQIVLPSGISLLGRGIMTLEGVLSVCSPQVNFIQILANHISGKWFKDLDLTKLAHTTLKTLYGFTHETLALPTQLSGLLKLAGKGQLKINYELSGAEKYLDRASRMVDKLVLGILSASLLVGASLISTTDITPRFGGIPLLGALGYFGAAILIIWLVLKMVVRKRSKY